MRNLRTGATRRDERGVETVAMLFVIPVLVILVLALIDVGMMFRARMLVENVARDTVRNAAADGGFNNPRTNTIDGSWEDWGYKRLYDDHQCQIGQCKDTKAPTMDCWYTTPSGGRYDGGTVDRAGDLVSCSVHYPYKAINGDLLSSPIGLGMGSLLKEFDIAVAARSETGDESAFGADQ